MGKDNGITPAAFKRHNEYFTAIKTVRVPMVTRVLALVLVFSVLGFSAFLYFVPWIQTTSGFGQVIALDPRDREQSINALVSGRIEEWFVRDGAPVREGDPILKLIDVDPRLIERLTAERDALQQQYRSTVTATQTAKLDFERKQRLFEDGLTSRVELENARIKFEDLRSKEAAARAALNRADVNLSRQSTQIVSAPRDGIIVSVSAGDTATLISAGQEVARFLPDGGQRAVELYIDGRDVSLIEPGRKVRLQFEGWPAVQFSGWPSIAVGTFPGEVSVVDPTAMPNGRFRILVLPDSDDPLNWPEDRFVRYGAKARGWVLLNKVRVGYELWRQLNNFPPEFRGSTGGQTQDGAP